MRGDQVSHALRVVLKDGGVQLLVDREGFEGHQPEYQVWLVFYGLTQDEHIFG